MTLKSPGSSAITVARGDGIGPEIMDATLRVLDAAGARLNISEVVLGERAYEAGHSAGIEPNAWDIIRRDRVILKAPMTTPQGTGFKSLNVTLRKCLGLYANVRPCRSYAPFVKTLHPLIDCVIVRENEEDLYAGIEHRQTQDVVQCLKIMSRSGCERIARYAFEYAVASGRKKVTCMTKDNIMKVTDGLFRRVFEEVGRDYPNIEKDHMIIDIGAARLAARPNMFDVILAPNLYGDILSDIAAELTGSVGLGASSNIGDTCSLFEAVHGTAPDIAGQDKANPSGLLLAAVDMLGPLGQPEVAASIQNAWLRTMEDGIHTGDLVNGALTKEHAGTARFAKAVCERLGEVPRTLHPAKPMQSRFSGFGARAGQGSPAPARQVEVKTLVGVDVFLDHREADAVPLAQGVMQCLEGTGLELQLITNRGTRVWPDGLPETRCVDHWRCRFKAVSASGIAGNAALSPIGFPQVLSLLSNLMLRSFDVIKTENLYAFDGVRGYSLGQGEG